VTKHLSTLGLVLACALASTAAVRTQETPAAQPARPTAVTPLKVQVVISRFQGDKKISSLPYTLSINSMTGDPRFPNRASLRMGTKVPVMMVAAPVVEGQKMPTAGPINYQDVGTNIDCGVLSLEDGRFRLEMTIDDSSVYPEERGTSSATSGSPSFRTFRATDSMVLKDGGTAQFTTATDKVNGEIVKVDVTLTVMK